MRTAEYSSGVGSSMHLPLMKKLAERFDKVFARINMNGFELQRAEQGIALSRRPPGKLLVRPAIRTTKRVEHDHLARLGVAQPNQPDIRHLEFALIGHHERDNIVLAARDL